jgi:hypothetical protein
MCANLVIRLFEGAQNRLAFNRDAKRLQAIAKNALSLALSQGEDERVPLASESTYGCKPWRGLRRAQSHPASAGAEAGAASEHERTADFATSSTETESRLTIEAG